MKNKSSVTAFADLATIKKTLAEQDRLAALMHNTPAADMQKNLKALLTQQFARLELVTREEFDTQTKVLAKTRAKLEELEHRLTEIENSKKR